MTDHFNELNQLNNDALIQLIEMTENFSKRPSCSDEELKDLSAKALSTMDQNEKDKYEFLIKNYLDNYIRGGQGINQGNKLPLAIISNDSDQSDPKRLQKPRFNKKQKVFMSISAASLLLIIVASIGIPTAVNNYKNNHIVITPKTTILFNAGEGQEGTKTISVYKGDVPQAIVVPQRIGYTFKGYYSAQDGGIKYFNENGYSLDKWNLDIAKITLYAHWQAKTTYITLNNVYGSGTTSLLTVNYDQMLPNIIIPHRTGYDFDGFYAEPYGKGTQYYNADGSSDKYWDNPNQFVTIYANWIITAE